MKVRILSFSLLCVLAIGCSTTPEPVEDPVPQAPEAPAVETTEAKPVEHEGFTPVANHLVDHEALNAILWTQTAAEYKANTSSIYMAAIAQLDTAKRSKTWHAAIEQTKGAGKKPPAIILDVDETVLDNSPYQARFVKDGGHFDNKTWNAWCNEKSAKAIPGALKLTQAAHKKGIRVFYVTNRDHEVEEATKENLKALGFPFPKGDEDVLLTKGEQEGWGSDKTPRRTLIAEKYRIVMLFGDNLGDFVKKYKVSREERDKTVEAHADKWGKMWFMLPNALYGSWESALFEHDYKKPAEERRKAKYDGLNYAR